MRVLIILIGHFFVAACSQKSAKVKLELTSSFAFGGSATQAVSEGGLMVWGLSKDGDSFSRVLNNSDAIELEIPNGEWTFTAVAWDSGIIGGATLKELDNDALRCARSDVMNLEGKDVQVSLELTTTNCATSSFSGGIATAQASLSLHLCQSNQDIQGINDVCTYDATNANRKSDKAPVRSLRLKMVEYDKIGKATRLTGKSISRCVTVPVGSMSGVWAGTPPDISVPVGDPSKPEENPFRMELELYTVNTNCDALSETPSLVPLPQGLASPAQKFFPNSGIHRVFVHVPDQLICNGRAELATGFAGGDGTPAYPYLICNERQLYNIHDNTTNLTKSFRLMKDIDLNPYTKGAANVSDRPAQEGCWDIGQTWQPLGYTYTGCTQSANPGFAGNFYGGGHSITGMRMRLESLSTVGFIGKWVPTAAGQMITGLTFIDADVEGLNGVGGVVGEKSTSNMVDLSGITMIRPRVESRIAFTSNALTGAVIGAGQFLNLTNVSVRDGEVQANGSYVGGVFGNLTQSSKISNVFATGLVKNDTDNTYVGGIGGRVSLQTGTTVNLISHEGVIVSGGNFVGGLFGWVEDGGGTGILSDFYAVTAITTTRGNNTAVGGIIGKAGLTGFITNGYFAGHISDSCLSSCNRGLISGANSATLTAPATGVYAISSAQQAVDGGDSLAGGSVGSFNNDHTSSFYLSLPGPFDTNIWVQAQNDLPRLKTQNHACNTPNANRNLSTQLSTGRGSATNPLLVCRHEQLTQIGGIDEDFTVYVKLAGAVNIAGGFATPDVPSDVVLSGLGGLLFGYDKVGSGSAGDKSWAPFGVNDGTIKDLRIANTLIRMTGTSEANSSVAGLVYSNNGVIDGVDYFSGFVSHLSSANISAAGVVTRNEINGVVRNAKFHANVGGQQNVSGLISENLGTLEDSVAGGRLSQAGTPSQLDLVAGIAKSNGGTIERVTVESRLSHPMAVSFVSLGVLSNASGALMTDIHVDSQAEWTAAGFVSDVTTLALMNDGQIIRAVLNGRLFNTDATVNTFPFTMGVSGVSTNNSIVSGVANFLPTGRKIMDVSALNCAANTMTITGGFPAGFPADVSGDYWDIANDSNNDLTVTATKFLWLVSESNGEYKISRVQDSYDTGGTVQLKFDGQCTTGFFGAGKNVSLIQSYAADNATARGNTAVVGSNYNGFLFPQNFTLATFPTVFTTSNSPWVGEVVAETTDLSAMVAYYLAILRGENPTKPAPWEFEDTGKLGLFNAN